MENIDIYALFTFHEALLQEMVMGHFRFQSPEQQQDVADRFIDSLKFKLKKDSTNGGSDEVVKMQEIAVLRAERFFERIANIMHGREVHPSNLDCKVMPLRSNNGDLH